MWLIPYRISTRVSPPRTGDRRERDPSRCHMPRMTGSRFFAEAMQAYEVSHVFIVPTIITPALAEMEGMGITRVTAHTEKAAVYMADAYARVSHRPGICGSQTIG